MKYTLLKLISFYQIIVSPVIKQLIGVQSMCRYSPSCSVYAKDVIEKYGMIKGISLAVKRIVHCQPFSKSYGNI